MCLGVPGKIIQVAEPGEGRRDALASVDFRGSRVEVSLSLVPTAKAGDWVLVHAGFALTLLDEAEAAETWRWLDEAEVVQDLDRRNASAGGGFGTLAKGSPS